MFAYSVSLHFHPDAQLNMNKSEFIRNYAEYWYEQENEWEVSKVKRSTCSLKSCCNLVNNIWL